MTLHRSISSARHLGTLGVAVCVAAVATMVATAQADHGYDAGTDSDLEHAVRVNPPVPPTPGGRPVPFGALDPIDSNFGVSDYLDATSSLPESSAWEPSGNFRTLCEFSHFANDDPIVFPGQRNASHLHMFFGNTGADAHSTYESLRTTGNGTCQGGPVNRSAYWTPAVLDARDRAVVPDFINVYYKGPGVTSSGQTGDVAELAPGLRMIAGAQPSTPGSPSRHEWQCENSGRKGLTIPSCGAGERVGVVLAFPRCWNGTELDADDHRRHLAYTFYDDQGRERCPNSHPVAIPELTIGIWFSHEGGTENWYLASDRMPNRPRHANGASFHADWFGGWDPGVQSEWIQRCINGLLNCDAGEIGNGLALSEAPEPAVSRFASAHFDASAGFVCDLRAVGAGTGGL